MSASPSVDGRSLSQAVTGVMPPQVGEARIRETWPTLGALQPGLVTLAKKLIRTVILAPLGWLLLAPLFALRLAPFVCKRYTLTNRRVMIQRGLKPSPVQEVALADIDEVRVVPDSVDTFYFSGDIEVLHKGEVKLKLVGVPEPEGFCRAIINAIAAWVPGKAGIQGGFLPASTKV